MPVGAGEGAVEDGGGLDVDRCAGELVQAAAPSSSASSTPTIRATSQCSHRADGRGRSLSTIGRVIPAVAPLFPGRFGPGGDGGRPRGAHCSDGPCGGCCPGHGVPRPICTCCSLLSVFTISGAHVG